MQFVQSARTWISAFFADPRRRAYGFATLGIAGITLTVLGAWLLLGGGDDRSPSRAEPDATETPVATATPSPTRTPPAPTRTPTRTPTPSPTPTPASTDVPNQQGISGGGGGGGGAGGSSAPAATPTPTTAPAVAAGDYCDNITGQRPPATIFGLLTIAGAPAPVGTTVTLLFDGAAGPSVAIAEAGGYAVRFSAGGPTCSNNPSASISVAVNRSVFPSGFTVASGNAGGVRFDIAVP